MEKEIPINKRNFLASKANAALGAFIIDRTDNSSAFEPNIRLAMGRVTSRGDALAATLEQAPDAVRSKV